MLAFENSNDVFLFTCWVSSSIRLEIRSLLVCWQSGPVSGHLAYLESGETGGPFFSPECSGTLFWVVGRLSRYVATWVKTLAHSVKVTFVMGADPWSIWASQVPAWAFSETLGSGNKWNRRPTSSLSGWPGSALAFRIIRAQSQLLVPGSPPHS